MCDLNRNVVGLNFYSLYLRRNADGSESESIATLTTNLDYQTGIDINVQPNLVTQIKVRKHNMITQMINTLQGFYKLITSVDRFKLDTPVVIIDYLEVKPGKRHYLVAYGVDGSSVVPPSMKEVTLATSVDSSGSENVTIFSVILLLSMVLPFLHV